MNKKEILKLAEIARSVKLFEDSKIDQYKIGDKIKVTDKEPSKILSGCVGTIVNIDKNKKRIDVNFNKKIESEDETFATHNLNGLIPTNTGLSFFDRGSISYIIDKRFDIRNIKKL